MTEIKRVIKNLMWFFAGFALAYTIFEVIREHRDKKTLNHLNAKLKKNGYKPIAKYGSTYIYDLDNSEVVLSTRR